ncbi:MAG: TIGR04255 family protein [Candidatus Dormiibacterota bacterium]
MSAAILAPVNAPFGDPVPSVHLAEAPLGLVVVQARFPTVMTLDLDTGRELVAKFQESIRRDYPLMSEARELGIALSGPGFEPTTTSGLIFRFASPDHAWQVSLSRSFVALHTNTYTERADLLSRLQKVLAALSAAIQPGLCERLGVRYSARLTDPVILARLPELIRPEILATDAVPGILESGVRRVHLTTDAMYELPDSSLRARWGILPPGSTIDPNLAPASGESFFIDIDVLSATVDDFDPLALIERIRAFSDHQYRYFRWMVTPEFLQAHGAHQ